VYSWRYLIETGDKTIILESRLQAVIKEGLDKSVQALLRLQAQFALNSRDRFAEKSMRLLQ
jgi:hypothetical protein